MSPLLPCPYAPSLSSATAQWAASDLTLELGRTRVLIADLAS